LARPERRVFAGEAVPAGEKLVSLFETHADIIIKDRRDVHYGHKLNLATGRSGLIFDLVIETGNPADAERFLPMLERHGSCAACRLP
jgi:IS5 family transposase